VQQDESELRASIRQAETLAQGGTWDEGALRINERILSLDEKNVGARTRLAKYHLDAGNVDEAGRLYEETLRIEPNNRIARNTLDRLARELDSGTGPESIEISRSGGAGQRHGVGSRRYPTPNDIEAARRYFESIYPDEAERRLALGAMVDTIRQIDRANILALGLTVRPTWSRFNVGRVGWGFFGRTEMYLIVRDQALPHLTVAQKERVQPSLAEYASLRTRDVLCTPSAHPH
jgi:tetratricopeptide (TPR) repeat protein